MFRNYLTVAVRNLLRHKSYSTINIAGLAVGMTCCILILLFVQDELSYDEYHENAKRIYRIIEDGQIEGKPAKVAIAPIPMGPALTNDFPELIAVRFFRSKQVVAYQDKRFNEGRFLFVDENVFNVFSFPLLRGNPKTALKEPFSIVLTQEMVEKYFGQQNPIGKMLALPDDHHDYKITGILKDVPHNSHFRFDFLASVASLKEMRSGALNDWLGTYLVYTYLLLPKDSSPAELEKRLPGFIQKYAGNRLATTKFSLQPVTHIHLYSHLQLEIEPNSDVGYIYTFSTIACFILLIACFNFMNLATARSADRAKEVGIRKVMGAYRVLLIKQFLGESLFLSFIALLFALTLAELFLPIFNILVGKALVLNYHHGWTLFGMVGIAVLVGSISGSYPAFFLSAFQPVDVLKGTLKTGSKNAPLRRILVTVQFAISIGLIIGTGIIRKQLEYVRTKDLGFQKDHVIVLDMFPNAEARLKYETVKNELLQNPRVLSATAASDAPFRWPHIGSWPVHPEGFQNDESVPVSTYLVDHDFVKTLGMKVVAGRDFKRELATDTNEAFLINEAAVEKFGWKSPEEAVGKRLVWGNRKRGTVIGVLRDFHVQPFYQRIEPLVLHLSPKDFVFILARINPDRVLETLDFLKSKWQKFKPDVPFEYFFLDDAFDAAYRSDQRAGLILGSFGLFAVFIACLGLFGLASFTAQKRTKEIGIRKVLGASVANIVMLLSREFVMLVGVANLIAWPMAYYAMNRWLQDFAYRIELGPGVFIAGGILALVIALMTVSAQAIRAARANPVDALRYE